MKLLVSDLKPEDRPLGRQATYGPSALSDAELLQALFNFKYLDTALELIAKAGSLAGVANLSIAELSKIEGIGLWTAQRIKSAIELGRRVAVQSASQMQVTCPADAALVVAPMIEHKEQEHLAVILLDTKNRVIGVEVVYIGTVNSIHIRGGEVFKPAIRKNATAMIIAHNHPSGDATPSPEDVKMTRSLMASGEMLDIEILDHIVIGHNKRWTSIKERGL